MFTRIVLLALTCASIAAAGQSAPQYAVDAAELFLLPSTFSLDVSFTRPLSPAASLVADNVAVTTTPVHAVTVLEVTFQAGSRRSVHVALEGAAPTDITHAQICFHQLTFLDDQSNPVDVNEVCSAPQLLTRSSIADQKNQVLADLKKVPKTSTEKNIFASGFVTTASTGTDGGAKIDLNSNDLGIPGLTAFMHLDKATSTGGDPKNFEAGTNFRGVLLFGRSDLQTIKNDIAALRTAATPAESLRYQQEIDALSAKHRFWSATLIDFAGKLEGEATSFNVANFVGDGQMSFQSRTQKVFGTSSGYWRLRLVPGGVEGGKNLNTNGAPSGTPTPDFVARVKGGGEFTLFYENPESVFPFKRVDLNLATAQRYLFLKEAQMSSTSNPTLTINRGYRPWYQAALKLYLVDSPKGKYGFQLTYNNGSLPPAFSTTKSFQFGFLYETPDGEDKKPNQ